MIFGLIKKSYETVMENPSITLYFVLILNSLIDAPQHLRT